jgi:hypothetical protein
MALPASRLAALILSVVVLLMAGAPTVAAKKGSHGPQRKEHRVEERSGKAKAKKGSRGHHYGRDSAGKGSKHGHHDKKGHGKTRHDRPRRHGRDTGGGTSGERSGAPGPAPSRLRLRAHHRIDVPEPKTRSAPGPATPRRPRPIRAWHPATIRAAAAETGRALAFPMALSLLALGFVLVHGRMDARDPKLARAPVDQTEQLVAFE